MIYNYIKAWGYKMIVYILRESLFSKQDKLIFIRREGIFMGYNKHTISYYRLYISNIYIIIIFSNIKFFKDIPNSSINNY